MFYARCSVFQTRVYSWPRLRPILFQPNKQSRHGENYYFLTFFIWTMWELFLIFDFYYCFHAFPTKKTGRTRWGLGWRIFIEDFQNISKATISQHSSKLKGEWNRLDFQFSISLLNISQVGILFQAQTSVAAPQSLMIQVCLKD